MLCWNSNARQELLLFSFSSFFIPADAVDPDHVTVRLYYVLHEGDSSTDRCTDRPFFLMLDLLID